MSDSFSASGGRTKRLLLFTSALILLALTSAACNAALPIGDNLPVNSATVTTSQAVTNTMPGDHDMMGMGQTMTGTMPGDHDMMGMGQAMTGTMPGNHDMMGDMMDMMKEMSPEEHQQMMSHMMGMMQGMGDHDMMGMGQAMTGTMPGDHDMMGMGSDEHMMPIPSSGVPDATENVGGQPLAFQLVDGVKVFELTAKPVRWQILDDVTVTAWTYNGTVPGPMIRVTAGDKVRVILKNELPEPTSIHWHGIPVPNEMDGVTPIAPGESFTYEFTAPPAGTFMYHSHIGSDKQVMVGMYAPLIVEPRKAQANAPDVDVVWMLSEWRVGTDGETYAAMPMAGMEPNYFTINGKAYPNTEPITVKKGQRVRIRLANIGQFTHPMHLHGMNFKIVAYDGVRLPPEQQAERNTIPVNPGEIVDIEFVAENPGSWMFHCHVLHHVTNDNVEPGGLLALINVVE